MMHDNCEICRRIQMIKDGTNPYFVAELSTGYVVIGDNQHFKGYTLFLCKQHETELHFLPRDFKEQFLHEMSLVAEAVYDAFHAEKMNYELLGNGDTHVHWHLFPRREGDTTTPGPVWWLDRNVMFSDDNRPTPEELDEMKQTLKATLTKVLAADAEAAN
ncbi:Hit Family Protein [Furfurilactobacillus rossiae]|uniref:HIT family protein n=1 Tax=Furfurilactobacillus rossiae TaxID=231049 RepID=UPI0015B81F04|nr:HIT family protein [Furfurilactobacillus rossiae]MCF6166275.1 HIT family protein [Furfurilactobacillus rossiae]QLE65159.1 Hit Family Protein [Furfurilactobacillus rossiae]